MFGPEKTGHILHNRYNYTIKMNFKHPDVDLVWRLPLDLP